MDPQWLTVMQNGSIGEARARAFLMDRFWILERSVDVHGVDLIVQRRLLQQNLLDRAPPRFAVVQVKFVESASTTHYIPAHYVRDSLEQPYDTFWVLVCSGGPNAQRLFLLSAAEIVDSLPLSDSEPQPRYRLSGTTLLRDGQYEVHDRALALGRIESGIELAEFRRSRQHLTYFLSSSEERPTENHIEWDFLLGLEHNEVDVRHHFNEVRTAARNAFYDASSIAYELQKLMNSADPRDIKKTVQELSIASRNG